MNHRTLALAVALMSPACVDSADQERSASELATLGEEGEGGSGGDGPDDGDDPADDADDDDCSCTGEADLPYNVNLPLGATFKLSDAFLLKGPLPAAVLELTMEDPPWRLAELSANTSYVVTQADCDHEGNHGTGRDRANITWQNADGSTESDHFTIRYCEEADEPDTESDPECDCGGGDGAGGGNGAGGAPPVPGCEQACSSDTECGDVAHCFEGCCVPLAE